MDRIAEQREKLTLPILGMHGDADEITLPRGTKELLSGVGSKDRTLWTCPKLVHDLLHEPEGPAIADGVARWLTAHTTAKVEGAALAAGAEAGVAPPAPCVAGKL